MSKSDIAGGFLGCTLTLIMMATMMFGVYRAFAHYGPEHGLASIFFPPYALYCGASYLWDDPRWKDEWETKSESIAVALASASQNRGSAKNEAQYRSFLQDLNEWVSELPDHAKHKLRSQSESFVKSCQRLWFQCLEEFIANGKMSRKDVNDIITKHKLKPESNKFGSNNGMRRVWEDIADSTARSTEASQKLLNKRRNKMESKLNHEKAEAFLPQYKRRTKDNMKKTLSRIFESK